ncbi:hypothetical protein PHET_01212 [Paragonimus heterotremus]|uniref:SCP domain-containing protein n=1 Tax=Paragonimus heterotremus TaxID=100268 RepID=A0A8J4TNB7_9TREM|nr:hypothetical protein PHET_01212 [Paragonimus heterotremus]
MPHWKANSILYRLQFSTVCLLLCTGLVTSKLTLEEKKLILKKHNALRQRIMQCGLPGQPPVQGYLHDLVWHEGLASKAAERANKCVTQAQPNKQNSGSSFSSIGQILIGNKGISHAIDVWSNQYKKYDFATNSCKGSTCLGYLQMVRESTKYVGCAVHECTSNPHYKSKKVIVCNYGPNEYVAGQRPYRRGSKVNCRISSTVVKSVLITKEQRVRILKEHNELRQRLLQCNVSRQPPVKGKLPALMWHDGLAKKAAEWAKHCPVARDEPKRRRIRHFEVVGQNVANSVNLSS